MVIHFVLIILSVADMLQPTAIVFPMKLDGPSNYREWALAAKTVLRGHGLMSHLTKDPPVDTSKDVSGADAVTAWTNDVRVMSAIVTSMSTCDYYFRDCMTPMVVGRFWYFL